MHMIYAHQINFPCSVLTKDRKLPQFGEFYDTIILNE